VWGDIIVKGKEKREIPYREAGHFGKGGWAALRKGKVKARAI